MAQNIELFFVISKHWNLQKDRLLLSLRSRVEHLKVKVAKNDMVKMSLHLDPLYTKFFKIPGDNFDIQLPARAFRAVKYD